MRGAVGEFLQREKLKGVALGPGKDVDYTPLQTRLQAVSNQTTTVFWLCVGLISIVFVVCIGLTGVFANDPSMLKLLFGATGVSVAWSVRQLREVWKERTRSELIVTVLGHMDKEQVPATLNVLLEKL